MAITTPKYVLAGRYHEPNNYLVNTPAHLLLRNQIDVTGGTENFLVSISTCLPGTSKSQSFMKSLVLGTSNCITSQ